MQAAYHARWCTEGLHSADQSVAGQAGIMPCIFQGQVTTRLTPDHTGLSSCNALCCLKQLGKSALTGMGCHPNVDCMNLEILEGQRLLNRAQQESSRLAVT